MQKIIKLAGIITDNGKISDPSVFD
jgi:hypothetical protein